MNLQKTKPFKRKLKNKKSKKLCNNKWQMRFMYDSMVKDRAIDFNRWMKKIYLIENCKSKISIFSFCQNKTTANSI